MKTKITINPNVNILYSSFYIKGLIDLYGMKNIVFDGMSFGEIRNIDANFNFILEDNGLQNKISVQINDTYEINRGCYEWSDVYGCVNTNWKLTPKNIKRNLFVWLQVLEFDCGINMKLYSMLSQTI